MKDSITTLSSTRKGIVWKVPLPNNPHYPYTLFHRRHEDEHGYAVLIVSLEKLLACHARDTGYVIPPYQQWDANKAEGILNFMRPSAFQPPLPEHIPEYLRADGDKPHLGSVELAQVHIHMERNVERPGFLGWLGLRKRVYELPVVSFTNGRHRTRFMQAMGVTHAPMLIENHQIDMMQLYCCD
jgi:hypothetical protein